MKLTTGTKINNNNNNNHNNNNNNNRYVPPQAKQVQVQVQVQVQGQHKQLPAQAIAPTTISYKEDFPTLLNTNKNKKQEQKDNNNKNKKKEIFSFASALNNEEKNIAQEAIKEEAATTKPGWVSIKRIDGKINYQYGEMTDAYVNMLLEKQKYERRLDRIYFKRRLDHLQRERDIMNDLLGDLSPYCGTRPLNERFNKNKREENESEHEEWEEEDDEDNRFKNKEEIRKEEVWTYVL